TGDAVVYYPAQSSSALVIYERGHVSAGEIFRFGLWMTLLGWVTVLVVALPWWSLVGEPLIPVLSVSPPMRAPPGRARAGSDGSGRGPSVTRPPRASPTSAADPRSGCVATACLACPRR